MKKLVMAIVILLVLSLIGTYRSTAITYSSYCMRTNEYRMLLTINDYREAHGLPRLMASRTLGAAARHHSNDIARTGYFSHTLPSGISWVANIRNHGYTYNTYIGENLAGSYTTASGTFGQWRNSPPHNANMLDPHFRAIGVGYAVSAKGYPYWTTTFGGVRDIRASTC